jgi:dihydrofolate reductase/thymidylate synthase
MMYQRSCDLGLGVPFNIAYYSLLTYMIAQVCGLEPGEFIHTTGDTHVYNNHIEPLQNQLERQPNPFPILKLNPDIKDIEAFTVDDIKLIGYVSHSRINMPLAI